MKIVLDTNVLLVAIPVHSPYHKIFQAFLDGTFVLCVTTDILNEYIEKLQEKYKYRTEVSENIINLFDTSPDVMNVTNYYFWNIIEQDPDDNKFVDCAISAGADYLVSNDRHFDDLNSIDFPRVPLISADEFLDMLQN